MKFIRSGQAHKYNDIKNSFEECQLKLHHDYLTFYKFKETCTDIVMYRKKSIVYAPLKLIGGNRK